VLTALRAVARLARPLTRALDAVIAVIIAPECAACARPLERPSDGSVCGSCWADIRRFTPPLCECCGDPQASRPAPVTGSSRDAPRLCGECRRHRGAIARARSIGPYDARLRDVIHAWKYDRRRTLASGLAHLLLECGRDVVEGADAVVPVPLHWIRRHERGFNQAALLAAGLGLPLCHALRRVRRTRPQVELPAGKRQLNVGGAFALARRYRWSWLNVIRPPRVRRLHGLTLVLVDDVSTTGATLDACARVLKDAGAHEVRALTAARVVSRPRERRRPPPCRRDAPHR
jgi:ComF family protein